MIEGIRHTSRTGFGTATVRLLNIDVTSITESDLLSTLEEGMLVTPNVDHLVHLQKNSDFYQAYQSAEWIVCDSRIVYFLSKLLPESLPEAIPGSSFLGSFYRYHKNDKECRIFLLGAAEGVAHQAMGQINRKVGREIVIGAHSPSYGFEKNEAECDQIIDIVNQSGATVLVIGAGGVKQEIWLARYRHRMPGVKLFMALGATIDFEAGNVSRAPKLLRDIGMEWLYRLMMEPKRMYRRYLINDPVFFLYFAKQLLGIYRNPFERKTGMPQTSK
ncbi:WecB/TagA/CpsF family glycosyltransferase [Prosthecochloris vibrioformis]|uniref:WecB/TagA/CpsF family glycosyltransferase n=1 Tax=Prosthecochloris vibrioformis TaxID=1098 RepID=A0A5C4S1B1_PROVB|nr:WecB/TagA/CpsF family glycosyltransferase [Prosthecochloris vibrioformis]TNJ36999.1 WecB/TagA/CpsF family glycosyltransferase [Prosthecochloris vibrioformis]